jgi:proline dehydrogenase
MLTFDNTEIAFGSKTNGDLRRAYILFRLVGNPRLVRFGKWFTDFCFRYRIPIRGMVKKTIFKQFCGGETIKECDHAIKQLGDFGIGTILDYSVEGKTSEADFDATVNEIIDTIHRAANDKNVPFAVFKVTGIGRFGVLESANNGLDALTEQQLSDLSIVSERIQRICQAAYDAKVPLFIDAEETWIQDTIDTIVLNMMRLYNKEQAIVFNTVQMYRHDRLEFVRKHLALAKEEQLHYGIKLVRGAYMEKERERAQQKGYASPIQPNKSTCDSDFNTAVELILENISHAALCSGSHNEDSAHVLVNTMEKLGIEKADRRVWCAQLLGMSDHISYNMAHAGYNVAKYVPYGPVKEVMPYLIRRANENTSVAGQTGRELSLLIKERNRRKHAK